ncbi:MAG TPA: F0F1 ATP synthase subunit [Chlorobaculum parvum]|uniref:F0F1 ATP synthase subunit n=1 Tax=Chlorobaculum parvum TaxID=274539 RepID=A0A7C5DE27_9CHLB|nr:F0F1 ATP synthase subunit [Chlorobaculum parvum]
MNERKHEKLSADEKPFDKRIGDQESRKIKARKNATRSIWEGFAMFGIIGWAVAIPTLIGVVVGIWLDRHYPSPHSWTLTMIVVGVLVGCLNAWHWVSEENRNIDKEE